jgi:hypothetical protein
MTKQEWRIAKFLAVCSVLVIGLLIFNHLPPTPAALPESSEWKPKWKSHDPAPTNAEHPAETHQTNGARRLIVTGVENDLLRAGFDVQVTFIEEDDSRMIIYGKSVNRPFAHNLMASSSFKKLLHDGKFTQVTFMDSLTSPDFSQVFQVQSRTPTT